MKPALQIRQIGRIKLRADLGAVAAIAYHARIAAFAQRKRQGINQDGLACPRFAGKRSKAGNEIELKRIDDDKVADAQKLQH